MLIRLGNVVRRLSDPRPLRNQRGQTLAEIGLVLPLLFLLAIGTMQTGFVIYQAHVVRKVAREGANMLSRQVTLDATAAAIRDFGVPHLGAFDSNAKLILSVVQVGTTGSNAGLAIITQRHTVGSLAGNSILGNPPAAAFSNTVNHPAIDPANNTALRAVSPLPNNLTLTGAETIFVAELFIARRDIAPLLWPIVINFDNSLYANAFF